MFFCVFLGSSYFLLVFLLQHYATTECCSRKLLLQHSATTFCYNRMLEQKVSATAFCYNMLIQHSATTGCCSRHSATTFLLSLRFSISFRNLFQDLPKFCRRLSCYPQDELLLGTTCTRHIPARGRRSSRSARPRLNFSCCSAAIIGEMIWSRQPLENASLEK